MRITREDLSHIIATEVRRRLYELATADDDEESDPKKPKATSADNSPSPKGKGPGGPQAKNDSPDPGTPDGDDSDPSGNATDGGQPDPETAEKEKADRDDQIDADGDAGEEPSGAVNDEMSGKTIQAITIEPESKVLPGAREVVIAVNESTDTLRILITPTQQIKFFWRGQLHDLP